MHEAVVQIRILRAVLGHAEPSVTLVVEVNRQWIPVGDQYPLTKVKLPLRNDQRILHILLNYPL